MTGSSDRAPAPANKRKERDRRQMAIAINQLATPGLGSWIAGHRLAGLGQMALASVGFLLVTAYMVRMVGDAWEAASQGLTLEPRPASEWQRPMILFGVAWLWSGITSIQIALQLRRDRQEPPRLPEPLPAPDPRPPRLG